MVRQRPSPTFCGAQRSGPPAAFSLQTPPFIFFLLLWPSVHPKRKRRQKTWLLRGVWQCGGISQVKHPNSETAWGWGAGERKRLISPPVLQISFFLDHQAIHTSGGSSQNHGKSNFTAKTADGPKCMGQMWIIPSKCRLTPSLLQDSSLPRLFYMLPKGTC